MTASYNQSLATDLDWIRFQIGDRGPKFVFSNEEISAILADSPNRYLAAANMGDAIMAQFRGVTSKSVRGLSISFGDGTDSAYRSHLKRLRRRGTALQAESPRVFRVMGKTQ